MCTILFLHGWHSVPGGVKPTYLKDYGHTVINPKLNDYDFEEALKTAQAEFDQHQPQVVVGSSRGGAVAMNFMSGSTKLVLLCPAWKRWGTARTVRTDTVILHSRMDDVIPFADSEELAAASGATLIEVGTDHRLADLESLSVLLWVCNLVATDRFPSQDDLPSAHHSVTQLEGKYICDACGEEIVVPLDLDEGGVQTFVEDCPVCCRANTIHVAIDEDGEFNVWAEPEQDY